MEFKGEKEECNKEKDFSDLSKTLEDCELSASDLEDLENLEDDGSYDSICGFELVDKIGKGAYGRIFNVEKDGEEFAVKIYRNSVEEDGANIEGDILTRFSHPYLMYAKQTITKVDDENIKNFAYLMPCADCNNLKASMETFNFLEKIEIIYKIAEGINFMHKNNMLHLDIKLDNIVLLDNDPVLVDFGTARFCYFNKQTCEFQCTTSNYGIPSNVFPSNKEERKFVYSKYNDNYSFLILCYFFLGDRELCEYEIFAILKDVGLAFYYLLHSLNELSEEEIDKYVNFFLLCNKPRTSFEEIVKSSIFDSFRKESECKENFITLFKENKDEKINAESLFNHTISYVKKYNQDIPVSFLFLLIEILHRIVNTFSYEEENKEDFFKVAYYLAGQCYGFDFTEDEYPDRDILINFIHNTSPIILCNYMFRGTSKEEYTALWQKTIVPSFKNGSLYYGKSYDTNKKFITDVETCAQFLKRVIKK